MTTSGLSAKLSHIRLWRHLGGNLLVVSDSFSVPVIRLFPSRSLLPSDLAFVLVVIVIVAVDVDLKAILVIIAKVMLLL